ncbi:uncharacterized protein A4U43_C03F21130 [Asparagus officinalis]|uniref:Uncharacterized protein n=1 Tax=Asparagus officinalis TaxID=4686 RepID=A0A5P1FCL8_ASPOF|nr:origin of replication complex subunit 1 [Asparagus officinalis]XP_020257662.1 origin of replication complex subunit 1 [Asparagus officinalis]ONK75842.1 uncharacterized protein A4U43_C03F21130 [Asparagus officinalis]
MANDDDDIPKTPNKRTTRSSSSSLSSPPKPPAGTLTLVPSDGLTFSRTSISLENLLSSLPGRRAQILDVLRLIGPVDSPMLPILLYGGASTGKTSTILKIFHHLNRPFIYVSCRSCYNPRILFESVLNQLAFHRKSESNGYSSARRCERASEFVNLLRDSLVQVLNDLGKGKKKAGCGKTTYLVFDNVEVIRSWDGNASVLSLLFRINDILRIPEVGFVYISSSTPEGYYLSTGSTEPVTVYFPDYTVEDLHAIFMRNQENPKLYSSFLSVVLKPFYRITRRLDELLIALEPLFQKYCEPLTDPRLVPDEPTKRRLFDNLQPHLLSALNETFKVPSWSSLDAAKEGISNKKLNSRRIGGKEASNELDFHMSVSAKYLLLSAFLASRNPATLDAALFDSTGGSNNRRRKRKSSQTSIDQKDAMAQEILMKGPGTFPLERLLAIFQCIASVAEDVFDEEPQEEGIMSGGGKVGLMSDVLLQLSTLCNANFLCKSGSCPLEGSTRYRSTVDEEMALKVARSINFPLSKYIYRR